MSRNRSFPHSLLFALLAVGLIAPAAQSAAQATTVVVCGTEACSASNTNATGIENLVYDGLVYDVTFTSNEDALSAIYGDPPEFDFETGGEAVRDSVLSALNSVPEVTTVGTGTQQGEFDIPTGDPDAGSWFASTGRYDLDSRGWFAAGLLTALTQSILAQEERGQSSSS